MFSEGLQISAKCLLMMFASAKDSADPVLGMLITAFTFLKYAITHFLLPALGVYVFNLHIINNEN